jgi:hypothetical protein
MRKMGGLKNLLPFTYSITKLKLIKVNKNIEGE